MYKDDRADLVISPISLMCSSISAVASSPKQTAVYAALKRQVRDHEHVRNQVEGALCAVHQLQLKKEHEQTDHSHFVQNRCTVSLMWLVNLTVFVMMMMRHEGQ